jgi:hypothetical protein
VKGLRQEADVLPARRIVVTLVAVVIAIALGAAIAWGIEVWRSDELGRLPPGLAHPPAEVDGVELEPFSVRAQGLDDSAAAERRLSTYGWTDRAGRVAHIPIERAMDLYLQRRAQGSAR